MYFQLNKKKYIELWLQGSLYFKSGLLQSSVIHDGIQGKPVDKLSSSNNTDCSGEKDDFQRLSLYGSPEDITDYSVQDHPVVLQGNVQLYSSESGQNFSYLPKHISDPSNKSKSEQTVRERKELTLPLQGLTAFGPSKIGHNVRATLAYAALSAVMEGDEAGNFPVQWFDGHDEDQFHKLRRAASTGSLSDNFLHSNSETVSDNGMLETSSLPIIQSRSCDKNISSTTESVTDYQMKKALGHSRSKSDQIGLPKFQKHESLIERPRRGEIEKQNSFSGVSRLSSSLPSTSGKYLIS